MVVNYPGWAVGICIGKGQTRVHCKCCVYEVKYSPLTLTTGSVCHICEYSVWYAVQVMDGLVSTYCPRYGINNLLIKFHSYVVFITAMVSNADKNRGCSSSPLSSPFQYSTCRLHRIHIGTLIGSRLPENKNEKWKQSVFQTGRLCTCYMLVHTQTAACIGSRIGNWNTSYSWCHEYFQSPWSGTETYSFAKIPGPIP